MDRLARDAAYPNSRFANQWTRLATTQLQSVNCRPSNLAWLISHGIPARALAIGLIIGSINAIITLAGALYSGDLAAVPVVPLGQAYALPLLFGVLSQAISTDV